MTALQLMKLRDPRSNKELDVIERQVKHMGRLVDDLLDVSRIERGVLELNKKSLPVAELIARAVEVSSPLIEGRRHHLEVEVASTGLRVLADDLRLTQVLSNLLTNAARYTDEGGHIRVRVGREVDEVVIRVRDTGVGISPDLLPKVFDLFVQGSRSADRRQGGLGLELSIVRSLVGLHGGTVEARSEGPGKGSEFVVRLPALALDAVPDEERAAAPQPTAGRHAARVLLVDDNVDAAAVMADWLTFEGFETRTAHDGPQALRALEAYAPDIAILDIGLPVMDGYELARRMVATLKDPPFLIALSGYGQAEDRARAKAAGFDEHMVKPPDTVALSALLSRVAAERSRRRAPG